MQNAAKVQSAAEYIRQNCPQSPTPGIGLVLGTGLGPLADGLQELCRLPYESIPGFPHSTVESHAGALTLGSLAGIPVWTLQGRFHLYEGYSPAEVCMGVRTLALLGVRTLIMTNAAGALNPQFAAGGLMLVTDHMNFTGQNPLTGPNVEAWGPRFPDMSAVYSPRLRGLALEAALEAGIRLERGVYIGVTGPCLETPAETRAYRLLGADAIGMSTVLEAIAARHLGLDLLTISCLTNQNLPDCMAETTLEAVIAKAGEACGTLARLLATLLPRLAAHPA